MNIYTGKDRIQRRIKKMDRWADKWLDGWGEEKSVQ